jgi:cell division protein FtsB
MAEGAKARAMTGEELLIDTVPIVADGDGGAPAEATHTDADADATRLRAALDTIDEKITLLLARHAHLAERYVTSVAARRDVEERIAELTSGGVDPVALEERVKELAARNERLARHAAYLEGRIESLLARVRYVLE